VLVLTIHPQSSLMGWVVVDFQDHSIDISTNVVPVVTRIPSIVKTT